MTLGGFGWLRGELQAETPAVVSMVTVLFSTLSPLPHFCCDPPPLREREHAKGYVDMLEDHFKRICLSQVRKCEGGRQCFQ